MNKFIQLVFGILLLILLFNFVNFPEFQEEFKNFSWFRFTFFLIFSIPLILVSAYKWKIILKSAGHQSSLKDLFLYYWFSYSINMLLPLGIFGADVARVELSKKLGGYKVSIFSVIQDRYTGFLVMFFISTILSFLSSRIPVVVSTVSALLFSLGVVFPFVAANFYFLNKYKDLILIFLNFSKSTLKVLTLSALFYLLTILNVILGAWVLDLRIMHILDLAALLPLVLLVSSLPISPQGLGIQEGFYVFLFQFVGLTYEQALLLALNLRFKLIIVSILGGIVYFIFRSTKGAYS